MARVVLEDLGKTYPDGFEAVSGINIEVEDGEFLILVGPSGCGKSTTLRMVAGLEEITAGKLSIGDRVVNELSPKERDIAMVFQSYALYPHMTVAENMGFALKLAKVDKAEIAQRVGEAAEILDLTEHLDRKPKALSGGQRQRVAMGRAIVRSPQCFLMDEPLSNLDAKLRVQMRAEIAALQKRLGVTTIYVTHDQVEAMTMGDRVAVLKRGFLMQCAPPQTLYDEPDNLFVASFIGSPSMNIAGGSVTREGAVLVLTMGSSKVTLPQSVVDAHPSLLDALDRPLAVGIRPEHFTRGAGEHEVWPAAEVTLVELLGSEMLVHVATETHRHAGHADILRELIDGSVGMRRESTNMPDGDDEWWRSHHGRVEAAAQAATD